MFNFFKRNEDPPPDVGKEDEYEAEKNKKEEKLEPEETETDVESDDIDDSEDVEYTKKAKSGKKLKKGSKTLVSNSVSVKSIEFDRVNAKLEALNVLVKGFNERFSGLNQQIGEIRAMSLNNEKSIEKSTKDAIHTVDLVKELKPEKLTADYQRADAKIKELGEKIQVEKEYFDTLVEEIKELKRRSDVFIGTEGLLKLNDEVKKDLLALQKLGARVRVNADKTEQIFIEMRRGFAQNEKINETVATLDTSYSGLEKELEKLKIDHSKVIKEDDFNDFKKSMQVKMAAFEKLLSEIKSVKQENEHLGDVIEEILSIEKKNEADIASIAFKLGNTDISSVSDYESRLDSLLNIIEKLAEDFSDLKIKLGLKEFKAIKENKNGFEDRIVKITSKIHEGRNKSERVINEINKLENFLKVNDLKSKKEVFDNDKVEKLIVEGEEFLNEGDLKSANEVYSRIKSIYNKQDDRAGELYKKIMEFYNRLNSGKKEIKA